MYTLFAETGSKKEEPWATWRIILGAGVIGLFLFVIGMFLRSRLKQRSGGKELNPFSLNGGHLLLAGISADPKIYRWFDLPKHLFLLYIEINF